MLDKKIAYFSLLLATLLWGVQPSMLKVLIQTMNPLSINVVRYIVFSTVLFSILLLRKEFFIPHKSLFKYFIVLGGLNALNSVLAFEGLEYSSAINSSIINTLTPVITVLLSVLFLKEKIDILQFSGLFISLFGAVFLVAKGSLDIFLQLSFNIGDIYFILSQVMWALYTIISAKILARIGILHVLAWSGVFGVLLMLFYSLFTNDFYIPELSLQSIAILLYISLFGGCLGIFCWNLGVKGVGSSQSAIFFYVIPVVGVSCAIFFLGEIFNIAQFIGACAIFTGIFITTQHSFLLSKIKSKQ